MKTTPGAVRMLALAALLALLGGARAGAAGGARGGACGPNTTPKITINADDDGYRKSYGKDIIVYCSAMNVTHLQIKESSYSKFLQVIELNTTTVQLSVKKPELGKYRYSCMDDETGCEDSLTVIVLPAMAVESSRAHYNQADDAYIVAPGDEYEVLCSGHDSKALIIEEVPGIINPVQTDVINRTSIKYRTQAERHRLYYCAGYGKDGEVMMSGGIEVKVVYYPECHNFSCVIYYEDEDRVELKCSWNYPSDGIQFKLLNIDFSKDDTDTIVLCSDYSGHVIDGSCSVNQDFVKRELFYGKHTVSLLLISCNKYLCNNQSFDMNTKTISKAHQVYNCEVLNTSTRGVALKWKYYTRVNYKLEYRIISFGGEWQQAVLSSVRCEYDGYTTSGYQSCEYELALLYPGVEYEVRVYARNEGATDDRLWSDPKSVLVTTEPRVEECACSAAPDTPTPPASTTTVSAETVSCEMCTLTEDTIEEGLTLKNKINNSLKKKLNDFKKIIEINKLLNDLTNFEI